MCAGDKGRPSKFWKDHKGGLWVYCEDTPIHSWLDLTESFGATRHTKRIEFEG